MRAAHAGASRPLTASLCRLASWSMPAAGCAAAITLLAGASCVAQRHTVRTQPIPPRATRSAFDRQVRNARDAGEGDYLLREARQRVATAPDDVAARLNLAKLYQDRGFPDVALEICRLAAARFPDSGEAQLALVRSLHALHQPEAAIASLEAFLRAHPQTAAGYYSWLGILKDETGRWTEGEAAHRQALTNAPAVDYLHNNLGYNLLMQKKGADAAAEFREALRLNPASELARNNLGMALAQENQTAQAVSNWQTAGDRATAHNNLAAVLMEQGNYSEARRELQIALGYNKSLPAALKNLELVSRWDGNPATLPLKSAETRWERWRSGLVRLFVGPLDPQTEAAKTASPQ